MKSVYCDNMKSKIGSIYTHPKTGAVVKVIGSHETIYTDGIHKFVDFSIIKDKYCDEGMEFQIPEHKFQEWVEIHQCDICQEYTNEGGWVAEDVWMCDECVEAEKKDRFYKSLGVGC